MPTHHHRARCDPSQWRWKLGALYGNGDRRYGTDRDGFGARQDGGLAIWAERTLLQLTPRHPRVTSCPARTRPNIVASTVDIIKLPHEARQREWEQTARRRLCVPGISDAMVRVEHPRHSGAHRTGETLWDGNRNSVPPDSPAPIPTSNMAASVTGALLPNGANPWALWRCLYYAKLDQPAYERSRGLPATLQLDRRRAAHRALLGQRHRVVLPDFQRRTFLTW